MFPMVDGIQERLHTPPSLSEWDDAPDRDDPARGCLLSLEEAIDRSRSLLDLEEDWDGEGSAGYREETWLRMKSLLQRSASSCRNLAAGSMPVPTIGPAQDGSIDALWKRGRRMFLLNIPADPAEPATYSGMDGDRDTTRGTLAAAGNGSWILAWVIA